MHEGDAELTLFGEAHQHDDAEQSEEEREEPQESSQVEIIEPPSPVKKSKNKYERAAERNLSVSRVETRSDSESCQLTPPRLQNFTQMVAGDLLGALGAGDDEEGSDLGSLIDDGEEQEDSESTAGHEEEEEEEAPAPKSSKGKGKATAKPKKRRSTSTAVSDDEGEDDASVSSSRASSSKPVRLPFVLAGSLSQLTFSSHSGKEAQEEGCQDGLQIRRHYLRLGRRGSCKPLSQQRRGR